MRKAIGSKNLYIVVVLGSILLIACGSVNIGISYQETKTDSISLIADDNNTFSDLSRNMTVQTGS
jgi:hypothetical protein